MDDTKLDEKSYIPLKWEYHKVKKQEVTPNGHTVMYFEQDTPAEIVGKIKKRTSRMTIPSMKVLRPLMTTFVIVGMFVFGYTFNGISKVGVNSLDISKNSPSEVMQASAVIIWKNFVCLTSWIVDQSSVCKL